MADLLQFLAKTPVQPRASFYSSGTLTDLDGPAGGTCTVTITLPDGSPGPASGTVSHVSTGVYSFVLDGPPDPIVYDIAWSGTIGAKPVTIDTQAEAVGELLFTIPELRELKVGDEAPFADPVVWPDAKLQEVRTATLGEFTRILGFSPVPRFRRETHDGDGRSACLGLDKLLAHKPLAVSVNGASQTIGDYQINDANQIEAVADYGAGAVFTWGRRNVVIEYVHGWERVEGDGSNVAMLRAAMRLNPAVSSQATNMTTADGTSYSFDPAGQVTQAGTTRHFGVPAIDAWLNRWSQHPQSRSGPLVA